MAVVGARRSSRGSALHRRDAAEAEPQQLPLGPHQDHSCLLVGRHELRRMHHLGGRRHEPRHRRAAHRHGPGDAEGDPASPGPVGGSRARTSSSPSPMPGRASSARPTSSFAKGSVADERIAPTDRRVFLRHGRGGGQGWRGAHGRCRPRPGCSGWLPGAAATIAIGTCATWGGVPAAEGNPTGAMSVMDFLGKDYRERVRLAGDQYPGLRAAGRQLHRDGLLPILFFLQGLGPLPTFDELRPAAAWLFRDTVHQGCTARRTSTKRASSPSTTATRSVSWRSGAGGRSSTATSCSRGAINHMGGCMRAGGICIGCTMPGFPDKFSPFYKTPPGAIVSTFAARAVGGVVRRLRRLSNREANREHRWDVTAVRCRADGRTSRRRR